MKLPQYRLLKISSSRKGTSIEAEWVDFVTCSECKLNPKNPRQYSDPDPVEFYFWCEMFADADGYCPFGK